MSRTLSGISPTRTALQERLASSNLCETTASARKGSIASVEASGVNFKSSFVRAPVDSGFACRCSRFVQQVVQSEPEDKGRRCSGHPLRHRIRAKSTGVYHEEKLLNNNVHFSPLPGTGPQVSMREPLLKNHVPIYVMLPLDTITIVNTLNHVKALNAGLRALKSVGVDGVMVDVWWGIVEGDGPRQYDWSAYMALVRMVNAMGLKVQAVMSFHACGGNVGDSCLVSLPYWVLHEAEKNPEVLYTDQNGNRNGEYLSLGVDCLPLFEGRSPVQIYHDFMESFRDTFKEFLGDCIVEVAVGMGPAGELRYPSYPEGDGRWRFPGIGEFQCYDKYMMANLQACAAAVGRPEWGLGGPHNSGKYNNWPDETGFFNQRDGAYMSEYGDFFLSWYAENLAAHGDRVLGAAAAVFRDTGVVLAGKLAGVHWWNRHPSHAAEMTAGYYSCRGTNRGRKEGYERIVRVFAKHKAVLNFTCVEMADIEQPAEAMCSPERLLLKVRQTAAQYGVPISGENALPRYDLAAHRMIKHNVYREDIRNLPRMVAFTFLRMGESLFQADHWRLFVEFVRNMDKKEVLAESKDVRKDGQSGVPHSADIRKHAQMVQENQVLQMQL